jgi:mannobiose 2-epimerase
VTASWPPRGTCTCSSPRTVETGFLFHEAEEALGQSDPRTAKAARRLVDHSLAWGFDRETGQVFERGFALDPPFDRSTQWWSQFETVNVLALMHERYGRETSVYGDAFQKAWRFARERLTDEEHRGVYLGIDEHGKVQTEKSGNWFVSYHTTRSLLLTAERWRRLAERAP